MLRLSLLLLLLPRLPLHQRGLLLTLPRHRAMTLWVACCSLLLHHLLLLLLLSLCAGMRPLSACLLLESHTQRLLLLLLGLLVW